MATNIPQNGVVRQACAAPTWGATSERRLGNVPVMGKRPANARGLKKLRLASGMTQDEAATAFGLSRGGYIKVEGGDRGLKAERIAKAAEVFKVTEAEVLASYKTAETKTLRPRRSPLISSFDPDEHQRQPDAGSEPRMVEGTEGRDVGDLPKDAILEVDVRLGMGGGGVTHITDLMSPNGETYAAEGIKGFWQLPPEVVASIFRVPVHRVRCFEAHGDSMTPTITNGDYVFVDIGHKVPSPPGIYALADALGGVILKRVEISSKRGTDPVRVRLISDNPHHTPEDSTLDEITITGRYLGRLTAG